MNHLFWMDGLQGIRSIQANINEFFQFYMLMHVGPISKWATAQFEDDVHGLLYDSKTVDLYDWGMSFE